jgi:hypothetical protein
MAATRAATDKDLAHLKRRETPKKKESAIKMAVKALKNKAVNNKRKVLREVSQED